MDTPGKTLGFWASLKHHPTQTGWLLSKVTRMDCVHWEERHQFYYVDMDISRNPWCAHDLFVSQVSCQHPPLVPCIALGLPQSGHKLASRGPDWASGGPDIW